MLFAGLSMLRRARVPSSRTVAEDTELDISLDAGDTLPFESKTCTIHFHSDCSGCPQHYS